MVEKGPDPLGRGRLALLCALAILIFWRLAFRPLGLAWRDWSLLLSLYAVACLLPKPAIDRRRLGLTLSAYLLALYLVGQAPQIARGFGGVP